MAKHARNRMSIRCKKKATVTLYLNICPSVKYSDVKCYGRNFTDFIYEPLSYLQNYPSSLVNLVLYKNFATLLVPLFFSPFPILWTFLKAAGRKASLSTAITLPFTRSSVKRKISITHKLVLYQGRVSLFFDSEKFRLSLKLKLIEDDANGFMKALY